MYLAAYVPAIRGCEFYLVVACDAIISSNPPSFTRQNPFWITFLRETGGRTSSKSLCSSSFCVATGACTWLLPLEGLFVLVPCLARATVQSPEQYIKHMISSSGNRISTLIHGYSFCSPRLPGCGELCLHLPIVLRNSLFNLPQFYTDPQLLAVKT